MADKKQDFIKSQLFTSLDDVTPETPAHWGKMSPQHMVEHLTDFLICLMANLFFRLLLPATSYHNTKNFYSVIRISGKIRKPRWHCLETSHCLIVRRISRSLNLR